MAIVDELDDGYITVETVGITPLEEPAIVVAVGVRRQPPPAAPPSDSPPSPPLSSAPLHPDLAAGRTTWQPPPDDPFE